MEKTQVMNFTVDRENKRISVEREFAAPLKRVWAAWTQKELLDEWWAPKPYKCITKSLEFEEGGTWLYNMKGPDGKAQWAKFDYKSIDKGHEFSGQDAFCDEKGKVNKDFPRSVWTTSFEEQDDDSTVVNIHLQFKKEADLDKLLETGFQEGFKMGMENLHELLGH